MTSKKKGGTPQNGSKYQRYYQKNHKALREAARLRMAAIRQARKVAARPATSLDEMDTLVEPNEIGATVTRTSNNSSNAAFNINRIEAWDEMAVEDEQNRLTAFSEIDHFKEATHAIHLWLGEWGGLESWNERLDLDYLTAKSSGTVDQWIHSTMDHAFQGRLHMRLLEQMETTLPLEMYKIRELWRQQTSLLGLVMKGLCLIELRVNIIKKGPFNLIQ